MNILILNWKDIKNPTAGGAEIVTYEHAKRWVVGGHNVRWLASSFNKAKKDEVVDGIQIKRFGNIYSIYLYAPFYYLFKGKKFDLVVDEVHGIPFFTPLFVRKPVLVLIHEIAREIWDYMYSPPLNYLGKFLEKIYLRMYKNKFFWTDAEATIDELVENGVKRNRCISIPCPSNLPVLSKLPVKSKTPTFVWVSRIVKMKGIEDVLEAFSLVTEELPDANLFVIGGGQKEYINYLKKEILKKHNVEKNVKFLGQIGEKEKINILRKSHLLLHASVKEGWGIVVIEAASQATPSVVYNVPGLSEAVKNGKTGVVVSKNTPEELAKESIDLLNNKKRYREMQLESLKWARSLTWDKGVYKSLTFVSKVIQNEKK